MIINANHQALNAISQQNMATADNIANVNTPEFKANRVDLETGPEGQGVQVGAVMADTSSGPLVPTHLEADVLKNSLGLSMQKDGMVEGSNTDLATEMTNLSSQQRAYQANVSAMRIDGELVGSLLDELA